MQFFFSSLVFSIFFFPGDGSQITIWERDAPCIQNPGDMKMALPNLFLDGILWTQIITS